jgi:hypothetical protein
MCLGAAHVKRAVLIIGSLSLQGHYRSAKTSNKINVFLTKLAPFFEKKMLRMRRLALQRYNTENSKQIFLEKELRGLSLIFQIHVSVSDLYIPMIGLPILLQENMWTDAGNI